MRLFANLFLILFLADGGFSLIDELVPLLSPLAPFTDLRFFLAGTVVVMAVPLYFCLGIDRRLPKRVFLPLILFVLFCPLATWFFPSLARVRIFGLAASALQVVLGMLPLRYFRSGETCSVTMPPELFAAPFFSLKNTLLFTAANLLVVPLALLLFGLAAADGYLAEQTSGFMHLNPGGVRMTERVYQRDNRTIRLTAMIHLGQKAYYDELAGPAAAGRSIVLAEGVTDNAKLLHNNIDYGRMAGFLGLTSQKALQYRGRIIEEAEFNSARQLAIDAADARRAGEGDILRADVDVSAFRPPTILMLNTIGKQLQESASFMKGAMALNSWGEEHVTAEMSAIIMDDILHRRNMTVIRHLDRALERYDTVIIPWGALHMKEIETEVLKRGFKLRAERERVSIDFLKLLAGKL